jgi:preprotein translocase subunit SecA
MSGIAGIRRFNIFAPYRKILKKAKEVARKVDELKFQYRGMSDQAISLRTQYFLNKIKAGQSVDSMLVEIIATVREAIFRVTGLFAYEVQIVGTYVLHTGDFAELYTGEGKTLVCVMAAYINALEKKGVHVITVNEYLVQRDAKFCAECLNPLGITVGYNLSTFDNPTKKKMFNCDITYTTNSELGFDYLRDNMVRNYEEKVIRALHYAIVDEGDSVLIDEARTPLIISGMPKPDVSLYVDADRFVKTLVSADYKIDPESNSISLVDSGSKKAESFFKLKNYYLLENSNLVHKIKNSLMANFIFQEGKEYIVKDNKILLIDQFTGRILEGRSYNAGLQQAIQAKEYVQIEPENVIVATITYQSFFRMYRKLAACSGTALTEEEEFMKIYNMVVVPIPTNKKVIRRDFSDYIFDNKISK